MSIASLVLGIVSLVFGLIPFCGAIAFIPAIVGLVLGIVALVKNSNLQEPKGMSIAGVVLNSAAIIFIIFWIFVIAATSTT